MRSIQYRSKSTIGRLFIDLIALSLLVGLASTPALSTSQAGAAPAGIDSGLTQRIDQLTATMSPSDRGAFTALVEATQTKLQAGGFTQMQHDYFVATLRQRGVSAAVAEQEFHDPIALVSIPVYTTTTVMANNANPPGKVVANTATTAGSCGTTSTTNPYMSRDGSAMAGNRLWTVKFVKNWCWRMTNRRVPLLPTATITSAPRWAPPRFTTTGFCIGCDFTLDWHDQYWYHYDPSPSLCTAHCGWAVKVNFHVKQCFGIGPFSQCMSPDFDYWTLRLHADGTFHTGY